MPSLTDLANPTRFLAFSAAAAVAVGRLRRLSSPIGLYLAFFVAPADYQQGDSVRIMYVHVPAAMLAMACYALMAIAALGTLVWRHPLADVAAKAAAPLGAAFTFLGARHRLDLGQADVGRLVGVGRAAHLLPRALHHVSRADRALARLRRSGAGGARRRHADPGRLVNLPIIKFSVDWWNTLHQPASILRIGGPSIHPTMLWPLLVMVRGLRAALRDAPSRRHAGRDLARAACAGGARRAPEPAVAVADGQRRRLDLEGRMTASRLRRSPPIWPAAVVPQRHDRLGRRPTCDPEARLARLEARRRAAPPDAADEPIEQSAGVAGRAARVGALVALLPLVAFLALACHCSISARIGDPSRIPSALLNKPVPDFSLPPIVEGTAPGLSTQTSRNGVTVVNVWASWCGPCRAEHPS